ncbi:hypothetical protein ABW286_20535 [Erwinia papayae]|uniref:Uncharacterized protein n=1 Tax=Erwinia papayae TaxID=206499 RepID=A0ABV3N6S8_9GAMM
MSMSAIYTPVPAVLQQPGTLEDILLGAQHLLSVDSVLFPDTHPLLILAVHGGHLSRRRRYGNRSELSVSNPEALRRWLNLVWIPLQQAAIEKDAEAFFSAEVSLLCMDTSQLARHVSGCTLWASLAALHFMDEEGRSSPPAEHAFGMALRIGTRLMAAEHSGKYRPASVWKAGFSASADTADEAEIFSPAWLEAFTHRAERVFTCAHRRLGTTNPLLPSGGTTRHIPGGAQ